VLRQLSCRSGSDMAAVVQPSWHNRSGTRWQNRRGEAVDPSSGGVAAVAGPPSRGCRAEAVEPRQWILGCRAKTVNSCRQAMAAKTWPSSRAVEPWPSSRCRQAVAIKLWPGMRGRPGVAVEPWSWRSYRPGVVVESWSPSRGRRAVAVAAWPWPSTGLGELWPSTVVVEAKQPSRGVVEPWSRSSKTVPSSRGSRAVAMESWPWSHARHPEAAKPWPPS
jgi:hypothetical protein